MRLGFGRLYRVQLFECMSLTFSTHAIILLSWLLLAVKIGTKKAGIQQDHLARAKKREAIARITDNARPFRGLCYSVAIVTYPYAC